jgi:hypothetical protein
MQKKIIVRRAKKRDLDSLVSIVRECFPDQIRWQVCYLSKKYWNAALDSSSCEIWIWLVNDEAAGFSQIVIDICAWEKVKRDLEYGTAIRLFAMITRPRLFFLKIRRKILILKNRQKKKTDYNGFTTLNATQKHMRYSTRSLYSTHFQYGGIYSDPEKLIWHELAAVLPCFRKLWLSIQIIRYCEKRAKKLQRYEICGVVEEIREHWCWMHERLGYEIANSERGRHTYVKFLSKE